jgi:hypothetical protein
MGQKTRVVMRGRVGVAHVRLSRWLVGLAAAALAVPVAIVGIQSAFGPWPEAEWPPVWHDALGYGVLGSVVLGVAGAIVGATVSHRTGKLTVEGEHLVMRWQRRVRRTPLASIVAGIVMPGRTSARVELELTSGDRIAADFDDVEEAERALEALGLDAARRRCTIALESRAQTVQKRVGYMIMVAFYSALTFAAPVLMGPMTAGIALGWLFSTVVSALLCISATRAPEITIGADGVVLPGHLGARFLKFDDLRGAEAVPHGVELRRDDGRVETMWLPRTSFAEAEAIALRVEEAIRAHEAPPSGRAAFTLLERGGRSLAEWRTALGRLASQATTYRAAGLTREDLGAILAHPASSAEHRLGAALALTSAPADGHEERLRIAADACASAPMRVALEKLAAGEVDDRAVEEALAASEPEATAMVRR